MPLRETALARQLPLYWVCVVLVCASCATGPTTRPGADEPPCTPECKRTHTCAHLDEKLLQARKPLLRCVANHGKQSNLDAAHRCFRALRLLESARWWLQTLTAETGFMPRVYRVPTETVRNQFLCAIESMARAKSATEVERIYMKIVRSYP